MALWLRAGLAHPGFFLWFCPLRQQSPRAWTGAGPAVPGLCFTALAPSSWRPSVLTGVTWTWAAMEPLLQETRVAAPVRGRVRGAETGPWGSGGLCSWALLLQDHLRHRHSRWTVLCCLVQGGVCWASFWGLLACARCRAVRFPSPFIVAAPSAGKTASCKPGGQAGRVCFRSLQCPLARSLLSPGQSHGTLVTVLKCPTPGSVRSPTWFFQALNFPTAEILPGRLCSSASASLRPNSTL